MALFNLASAQFCCSLLSTDSHICFHHLLLFIQVIQVQTFVLHKEARSEQPGRKHSRIRLQYPAFHLLNLLIYDDPNYEIRILIFIMDFGLFKIMWPISRGRINGTVPRRYINRWHSQLVKESSQHPWHTVARIP